MRVEEVRQLVNDRLIGRRLLTHPFYRRWEDGRLRPGELARYAEQYRPVEAALPEVLDTVVGHLGDGPARTLVCRNLADERDGAVSHVDLFEGFARAVGAGERTPPGDAASSLVGLERASAAAGAVPGVAALAAYEVQAAEIARSKSEGLRRHYDIGESGTRFWDVHASLEAEHAEWSLEVLAQLAGDERSITGTVDLAAQAWWDFLDEREAEATT